ncbi:hypothetical protein DITRI_Ditri01bG0047500 [Diplodiscus trichospermus]
MENLLGDDNGGYQQKPRVEESRVRSSFKDTLLGNRDGGVRSDFQDDDGFISEDNIDGEEEEDKECPIIMVSKKEKARLRRPWRQTLIVKVLGRSIGYNYLLRRIKALWMPKAQIELVAIDNDYFIVKFESKEDYDFAKFEGPWMVMDHYLIVKEWSPNFDPIFDNTKKVLVWVRFPCLPIEYYDKDFLMKNGSKIGQPVMVDQATSLASRGKFARICIEVDITKPLLAKFQLRRRIRRIEYEGIHLICFLCGVYGHHWGNCPGVETHKNAESTMVMVDEERRRVETGVDIPAEITKNFGPWMMVSSKPRKVERNKDGRGDKYGKHDNRKETERLNEYGLEEGETSKHMEKENPFIVGKLGSKGRRPNVQQEWEKERTGSRQAAAAEEHMVVRASQGARVVVREVVNNVAHGEAFENCNLLEKEVADEHHQDPPIVISSDNSGGDMLMEDGVDGTKDEVVKETLLGDGPTQRS